MELRFGCAHSHPAPGAEGPPGVPRGGQGPQHHSTARPREQEVRKEPEATEIHTKSLKWAHFHYPGIKLGQHTTLFFLLLILEFLKKKITLNLCTYLPSKIYLDLGHHI